MHILLFIVQTRLMYFGSQQYNYRLAQSKLNRLSLSMPKRYQIKHKLRKQIQGPSMMD